MTGQPLPLRFGGGRYDERPPLTRLSFDPSSLLRPLADLDQVTPAVARRLAGFGLHTVGDLLGHEQRTGGAVVGGAVVGGQTLGAQNPTAAVWASTMRWAYSLPLAMSGSIGSAIASPRSIIVPPISTPSGCWT